MQSLPQAVVYTINLCLYLQCIQHINGLHDQFMPIFTMYSTYKIRQHSVKTSVTTHSKNLINCVGYRLTATLNILLLHMYLS